MFLNELYACFQAEREDEIRKDVKKKWTVYLVVAVLVTLVLTAIVTALIMRACCGPNGSEITPRD